MDMAGVFYVQMVKYTLILTTVFVLIAQRIVNRVKDLKGNAFHVKTDMDLMI